MKQQPLDKVVPPTPPDESIDLLLTDPQYCRTARRLVWCNPKRGLFSPLTFPFLYETAHQFLTQSRNYVIGIHIIVPSQDTN